MIVLGFDFGTKRIGVAVGQSITQTATPIDTITAKMGIPDWQEVANLIEQWSPAELVVGVPLKLDGSQLSTTSLAQQFATQLREHTQLPVHEFEERLSTKSAREMIFERGGYKALQKSQIDSVAAALILEHWLLTQTVT